MTTSSDRELRRLRVLGARGAVADWVGVTYSCIHVMPRKVLTVEAVSHRGAGMSVSP